MTIASALDKLSSWVWGPPMLVLLVGTGIFLTILLKGIQFRLLPHALYLAFIRRTEPGAEGDVSHFQALMTALAATVGIGNIAGVATAIALGGPGAMFWMWMTGLVGMATKYAEAYLGVKYRVTEPDGTMTGGPMLYLSRGLNQKWLGAIFAAFAAIAAFGIGDMVQANSVADALRDSFQIPTWITGLVLMVGTAVVVLGGIQSIAWAATVIVPVMAAIYMLGGLAVLIVRADQIPAALMLIVKDAFTGTAVTGGFAGSTVMMAMRYGVARGVFSNESGLGTGGFAAAAAKSSHPSVQALVSMTQTFIDTLIVCSVTGLVIVVTGAWSQPGADGQMLTGAPLTTAAFSSALPGLWGKWIVTIGIALFAYSTLVGWAYYGERAILHLFGFKALLPYRIVYCALVYVGAVTHLTTVWAFADVMNGLMALPNLIGLIGLSMVVARGSSDLSSKT